MNIAFTLGCITFVDVIALQNIGSKKVVKISHHFDANSRA